MKQLNKINEGGKNEWEVNDDISVLGIPFKPNDYDRKNTTEEEVKELQYNEKVFRRRGGMLSRSYYCRFCKTVCSAVWKLR